MSWQPIETAPKDGTRVLLLLPPHIVCGQWEEDRYSKKPRPYWTHDKWRLFGIAATRQIQPTHWMPLPEPMA